MYPRDAVTTTIDDPANNSTILASTSTDRTFLHVSLACQNKSGDIHVLAGSQYLYDYENSDSFSVNVPVHIVVPSGTAITYTESATNHCSVQLTYVNRDRTKTLDPATEISTSSIQNITVNGTIPLNDFLFISCVFLFIACMGLWRFVFRSPKV